MRTKITHRIKSNVRYLLGSQGYAIVRMNSQRDLGTMEGALRAIARRKHTFATVVDVGASNGSWSHSLMKYFPLCQYLLIEAQPIHESALRHFCDVHRNAQFVLEAAGDTCGKIHFDASDPFGGQASATPYSSNDIEVPMTTIDYEIEARSLGVPYLLKLDTHGFEVPILKGAFKTLTQTEVIVMECYNFRIAPECLLFYEMCVYLETCGFRCIDLVDPLHRPHDGAFWQMDLVFVRTDRPEFSYREYR